MGQVESTRDSKRESSDGELERAGKKKRNRVGGRGENGVYRQEMQQHPSRPYLASFRLN